MVLNGEVHGMEKHSGSKAHTKKRIKSKLCDAENSLQNGVLIDYYFANLLAILLAAAVNRRQKIRGALLHHANHVPNRGSVGGVIKSLYRENRS